MKVSVLHGGNTQAVLKKLDEIVAEFGPPATFAGPAGGGLVVRASGKEITEEFILNNFAGSELFEDRKLVILTDPDENWQVDQLVDNEGLELVLVYNKELGVRAKVLKEKRVISGKIYDFIVPQDRRIWGLLDMVLENDPKMIKKTAELLEEFGGQYLLTMLVFNLRRLVVLGNAPDFVKKKLIAKRDEWGISKISEYYADILETDLKIKTGMGNERDLVNLMVINWAK